MPLRAYICVFVFRFTASVCAFQQSFECSCSPRTRTTGDGAITLSSIRFKASRSKLLLWVKCMRVYFYEANRIPCVEAQTRHRSCADSRVVQFSAVDSLYVSRFMSPAKPRADKRKSGRLSASSSGAL